MRDHGARLWIALVAMTMGCMRAPTPAPQTVAREANDAARTPLDGAALDRETLDRETLDRAALERAMGRPAAALAGGVLRFGMPRTDLRVRVGDIPIRPGFALGSWVAFVATAHGAVAMGDLVLLDAELGPVLERLQANGIEQTAIHHHLVGESPHVVYVHIHAHGDPVRIAAGVRAALVRTGTPSADAPAPTVVPPAFTLDSAAISTILGRPGTMSGGVLQIATPRPDAIVMAGDTMPATMGLATLMNFQATGTDRAAITGDFVLRTADVNRVIRALQANGITPTSLHNHLLDDEPRLMFLHFWAEGEALVLARGLKAGLDAERLRQP